MNFDGTDDQIDFGNPSTLNTSLISVSAWIKPSVVSGVHVPVGKATGGGDMSWNFINPVQTYNFG
jgi:hypothetical protein